jgi:predicted Zn-dependent protease
MPSGARLNIASEPLGTVDTAIAHAKRLLGTNPDLAAEQAREILSFDPANPTARLVLGAAQRRAGRPLQALTVLEALGRELPNAAPVFLELGVARAETGHLQEAIAALKRAVTLKPDSTDGWRLLADYLDAAGDCDAADAARARYIKAATGDPRLMKAAAALVANELPVADTLLRSHLAVHPTDVAALRMLAEVAARLRRYVDAEDLLERCLELAPSFDAARHNYAVVLNRQAKPAAALKQVEQLLAKEPRHPAYLNLQAAVLANLGEYANSISVYEAVLRDHPLQPKVWMSFGHALRTAGRLAESITAYRRALDLDSTLGEAYWSLANLKTYRFSAADTDAMREALARTELSDDDRLHFEFSLGKACEDDALYQASFDHYAKGNAIRKKMHPHDAGENTRFVERSKRLWTPEFFEERSAQGAPSPDPIFIVGLPRAGSTLVEQILSSHPLVEGTAELPDIPRLVRELAGREEAVSGAPFFETVARLSAEELSRLGEEYLASTRVQRKTAAPFFVDKMPNNCLYAGFIHLILPNAKIIDVRRHPLGCCFSVFKQQFARGQNFAFDLTDLGLYYRDYVDLMAHVDTVLPGVVHRVIYESLIDDTETEVRRLLDYCGLPFDARCLKFYENDRAVRTPSSQQVRQPIFKDGVEHWRHYEPWLGPLKDALGAVLERDAGAPEPASSDACEIVG